MFELFNYLFVYALFDNKLINFFVVSHACFEVGLWEKGEAETNGLGSDTCLLAPYQCMARIKGFDNI